MTLRHLKIFLALCENDFNMTRAAEALLMSQPAVSLAIKEMEEKYNVKLFDRIGRRLIITQVGKRLREYALRICSAFDEMEKEISDWDNSGIIRIGAGVTIGSRYLAAYVSKFKTQYPQMQVKALVNASDILEEKLLTGELDIILIEGISHNSSLISEEYMLDRLSVICPNTSKYSSGSVITIDEFKKQKFLLREKGSATRELFDRCSEAAGFSVNPDWEATSTAALVSAVENGLGFSVLPVKMILVDNAIKTGSVKEVFVEGMDFSRKFNMIYHKDKYIPSPLKAFMDICREAE